MFVEITFGYIHSSWLINSKVVNISFLHIISVFGGLCSWKRFYNLIVFQIFYVNRCKGLLVVNIEWSVIVFFKLLYLMPVTRWT